MIALFFRLYKKETDRTFSNHFSYWYKNGCLAPDLISMFMAMDPCVKENGGLRVSRQYMSRDMTKPSK